VLVLLWGVGNEQPLAAVRKELRTLGVPTFELDQRDAPETGIEFDVGCGLEGEIRVRNRRIDLAEITAAYLRPYVLAREDGAASRHTITIEHAMTCWSMITPALVVNRPQAMAANDTKPCQMEQIRQLGFRVPETLLTTDPDAAWDFWKQHGAVVYKSVSGTRSIVSRLRPAYAKRLANVSHCPTQFQEYVPGTDHRVHVVGDELFASEIVSDADDYRYPARHRVEIRACRLPEEVGARCRRLAGATRLPVAGIDLRRTPDGEWYCFEVNPSPAFTYYESRTRQPIGRAIARFLAGEAKEEQSSRTPGTRVMSLRG
jgi:glutathione synthase/RimK-type ligase-like ATP-grasp enzyme